MGRAERPKPLDRDDFIRLLRAEFPEVLAAVDGYQAGLLHCEVGVLLKQTAAAMDAGREWLAQRHFALVERLLGDAGPELASALEVSYLEGLAFGEHTPERHRVVRQRMPGGLRRRIIELHNWWK